MTDPVEDAEGRRWYSGLPTLSLDDAYRELSLQTVATKPVRVDMVISLSCDVMPGQPVPDAQEVMRKVLGAVTRGGPQGRRLEMSVGP